jgi:dihydrofolate reductase
MSRRVAYYISLTVDGMYADPDGGLYAFDPAEDEHRFANDLVRESGDIVMGRVMYGVMEYWDELDLDDPTKTDIERDFATVWRATPKHVVTRGQPALRGNSDILQGDVVEAVRAMKAGEGPPIMLGCGADLFATLAEAGLIDDFRFLVTPVALGEGKALFASLSKPLGLRSVGSRVFSTGNTLLEFVRRDEPTD